MLSELPTDCLRLIFTQVADHKDIFHAGQTNVTLNEVNIILNEKDQISTIFGLPLIVLQIYIQIYLKNILKSKLFSKKEPPSPQKK